MIANGKAVLLVDDDSDTRVIYGRVLTHAGYRVIEATTGREAIDVAQATHPDTVILDLGLPDIDGLEVARALRASVITSATSIIILTAYVSNADQAQAIAAGCDAYLGKPIRPRDLLAVIQRLADAAPPISLSEPLPVPLPESPQSRPEHPAVA
jgi:CheY-like chemotaxis protein